jgi:uncharacterized repeat protein (TIGR01451 family)
MLRRLMTTLILATAACALTLVAVTGLLPNVQAKPAGAQPLSAPYTQNFDSLANTGTANPWTDDSTLAGWYAARAAGGPLITSYRADAGTSNAGALYSYGITGTTERALGSVSSGTPSTIYYGLRMHNDTGAEIAGVVITYTGEQWRQGGNTSQQNLAFAYQVGSVVTDVMAGAWTNVTALDFVSPITSSNLFTGALDGNAAANRVMLSVQVNVTLLPDEEIMFRWMDINDIGNDHGLGVDDLSIMAIATAVPLEADLAISKSGPASASAGDPIAYTIDLSNTGILTATSTIVTDTLPAEVTFITYTGVSGAGFSQPDPQTLVWDLGDVAGGTSNLQIEVQGTISAGLSNGTSFVNMVVASTTATETTTSNNTASITTTIGAPDLIVVKDGPASVNAGDPVAYTLTYSNAGNLAATGVMLVDQLPAAMSYVADSLGGTQTGNTITWTLGSLPINASGSIVLTATALTAGDHANVATISGDAADSDPLNNISIFTTTVLGVDPYVLKTGPAAVFGGELVTYTISYGNYGNVPADVEITDTLPVSFTTAAIAYDDSGLAPIDDINTRSWTATLAADDRFTFTLALTVPTEIANNTRITNTVDIATEAAGNVSSNDQARASSTVYQIVPIATARAGTTGEVFGIEGSVIYVPGTLGTNEWGMQDTSGGISMFYTPVPVAALGDRMRVVATRGAFSGQPQLGTPLYYSANLGSGPQVTPRPYTTGQVASGSTEGWLIVITGTVSSLPVCTPGTANYQFNLDDGSGSTVIFVDKDTLVDVCALGVVDGDPLVVTGFSTQYNGLPELKPRFPADVQRIYQVTFVYNDLEDVVAVGEDVQLRGDFTNWAANPITLAHDAGYTVFSTTLTLPTDVAQNYKYFVPAGGGSSYDWLNTNDRSIAPQDGVTVQNDYRNVVVGWANLQWPPTQSINLGQATANIYGRLYIQGVTNDTGAGRGLKPEVGYGMTANPATWSWSAMQFNAKDGPNNDEYTGIFTPTASGVYSYATRYNGNWGVGNPNSVWTYASRNGIPFDPTQTGVLTVTAPQLSITKTVATAHPMVDLGEVVTYTFTLSNTGDGAAANVLITDVLPAAVTFGGFVQQNGAVYGSGAITWSGSLNVGASATVIFTATVKNDRGLHGTNVLNTVQFTSGNDGSGSADAIFAIVNRYFTYLPFIRR